jgi:hypothetical protein
MSKYAFKLTMLSAALALGLAGAAEAAQAGRPAGPPAAPPQPKSSPERVKKFAELPDWSGIWYGTGTLFDQSKGGRNPNGVGNNRDFPPYKPDWQARYDKFLQNVVIPGKFVDPLTLGYLGGFPRMMAPARGLQFLVTPEEVLVVYERPDVRYIYTDGRSHPPDDELFPTWEGHSVGHWEGDVLVVDTVGIKGGIVIDRTGLVFSDQVHITERIRKTSEMALEDVLTIEDPVAFTKPWVVRRTYRKSTEKDPTMTNVSSLENNRNPIVNGETTVVLDTSTFNVDDVYPPDIKPFATP